MRYRQALRRSMQGIGGIKLGASSLIPDHHQNGALTMAEPIVLNTESALINHIDKASALAIKLEALLTVTCGEQGETFRDMNHELQGNFMWTCAGIATDLRDAISDIGKWQSAHRDATRAERRPIN